MIVVVFVNRRLSIAAAVIRLEIVQILSDLGDGLSLGRCWFGWGSRLSTAAARTAGHRHECWKQQCQSDLCVSNILVSNWICSLQIRQQSPSDNLGGPGSVVL